MVDPLRTGMKSHLPIDIGKQLADHGASIVVKACKASQQTLRTP
jgi:hypothetical protein